MRLMVFSITSTLTGRFSSARNKPARSLSSLNGSRAPLVLITRGITNSALSKVVKRSLQALHSRRRRTDKPSATNRESITLVSCVLQKGQCKVSLLSVDSRRHGIAAVGATLPHHHPRVNPHTAERAAVQRLRHTVTSAYAYTGNLAQSAFTCSRTWASTLSLPILSSTSQIQWATCSASATLKPRRVIAGVPKRKPEVTNGERGSFGTEFLFTVMYARPSAASASFPVISLSIRSTKNKWFSVPFDTIL